MKMILVIDDDEIFRFIFAEWLKDEGFCPITAEDGFEGIRLAQSCRPDLIFCDVNMPTLNGIEVLKQVRNYVDLADTPFFFLTSETRLSPSFMRQFRVNGIISKGSEIKELRQALTLIEA